MAARPHPEAACAHSSRAINTAIVKSKPLPRLNSIKLPYFWLPMEPKVPKQIFARQQEITASFLNEIDKHLLDLVEGRAEKMFEIRDLAEVLHIHPTHLSNTIKLATGKAPCFFFEDKILTLAKAMLEKNDTSIAQVATTLTYDPSNFTKFFKTFTQLTPKQYREQHLARLAAEKTEAVTI